MHGVECRNLVLEVSGSILSGDGICIGLAVLSIYTAAPSRKDYVQVPVGN